MPKGRYTGSSKFKVGDKVRLKGSFLRSTGQYTGHDAHAKWTVVAVRSTPDYTIVSVDEPQTDLGYWTPEEVEAMKVEWQGRRFVPRHINASNLISVGKPDHT